MIATLLSVALIQGAAQAQAPQAPPRDAGPVVEGAGIIRGRVVAEDTGAPLRGCRVSLMTGIAPTLAPQGDPRQVRMDEQPAFSRTDEDGRYEFVGLKAGTYRVSAAPEMGSARYLPDMPRPGMPFGKPFELTAGQKLEVPDIRLIRAGVLAGRVVNESGEPVAHVRVNTLIRMGGGEPRQAGMSMNGTDDLGRFRLFGLRPGVYYLVAESPLFSPPTAGEVIRPLPTYLPSSLTLTDATPVRLDAGQEIADLEIRLISGRTFTIRGTMVTSQGQPITRQSGHLMFLKKETSGMSGSTVDHRDDGTFEIRGVKPGMYELEARRHDELPHGAEYAAVPIAVVDTDVEGLIVATRPGAAVAGEVVLDGARPDSCEPIYVTAMPATAQRGIGPSSGAQVAPDGTFTLRDLFRPVYIRVSTPSGFHLASVIMDGQDITDTPMQFASGKTGRLQVSLSSQLSELSGQVRTAQGRPTAALVFAFGEDRALWSPIATTTKSSTVGEKGDYRFTGLRPGRYFVVALPLGSRPPVMFEERSEAWEALAKQATLVTIGDQERKTLDLKLATELDR